MFRITRSILRACCERRGILGFGAICCKARALIRCSDRVPGQLLSPKGVGAVCGLLVGALVGAHQPVDKNASAVSRLALLRALVEKGSVCIDEYAESTGAKSAWGGHYYSDKAPGTVVLAFPAFAASAIVLEWLGVELDSDTGWLVSSWAACAGSIAVIAALGGALCFVWLSRYVPRRWALVTVLGIWLGAAPLPYSTMMFSHGLVVGLLAIGLWAIEEGRRVGVEQTFESAGGGDFPVARESGGDSGGRRTGKSAAPADKNVCATRSAALAGRDVGGTGWWGRFKSWLWANRYDLLAGHVCG